MPTFGLSEENPPKARYLGSNDMFFRQWRAPSMAQVFEKRRDRDFKDKEAVQEKMLERREERRNKHNEKFDLKMKQMAEEFEKKATVSRIPPPKKTLFRQPTEQEKRNSREKLEKEFMEPSSTAIMSQARQLPPKPRATPVFGNTMASQLNIIKPPKVTIPQTLSSKLFPSVTTKIHTPELHPSKNEAGTPKESSFLNNSQETVFYPQTHSPFNLDNYNGARPSFAFPSASGGTSTPVSKIFSKFSVGSQISEETFGGEDSKYITALESPIPQTTQQPIQKQTLISNVKIDFGAPPSVAQKKIDEARRQEEENLEIKRKNEEESRQREIQEENDRKVKEELEKKVEVQEEEEEDEDEEYYDEEYEEEDECEDEEEDFGPTVLSLFKPYIDLLPGIQKRKQLYEENTDADYRAVVKRTITEKITVYTQKETDSATRDTILQFFKKLLKKETVDGFAGVQGTVPLELVASEDVEYAMYCIVDKYMALVELDVDLATSISHLISYLTVYVKPLEKMFICLMMTRSVVLRQVREECLDFADPSKNPDEAKYLTNKEDGRITLFLNVFAKNAIFASKGKKMCLTDELLWEYTTAVINYGSRVPKSEMILTILITTCKPRLSLQKKRWEDFKTYLKEEFIPKLQEQRRDSDAANIGKLRKIAEFL